MEKSLSWYWGSWYKTLELGENSLPLGFWHFGHFGPLALILERMEALMRPDVGCTRDLDPAWIGALPWDIVLVRDM